MAIGHSKSPHMRLNLASWGKGFPFIKAIIVGTSALSVNRGKTLFIDLVLEPLQVGYIG